MLEEQQKIDKKLLSLWRPVALHKLATYVIKYGKLQRAGEPAARLPAERVLRERPSGIEPFVSCSWCTVAGTRTILLLYIFLVNFFFFNLLEAR